MSVQTRLTPSSSQTVGPYFRIGLHSLVEEVLAPDAASGETITIRGRVLDCDGVPVPDAMLEFWSADRAADADPNGYPQGFRRAPTGIDGDFSVSMCRPASIDMGDGRKQAPHMLVLVFARGLLRNLVSRVYFGDDPANASDPVLLSVPAARRRTLIACRDARNSYRWDVVLQGAEETVFFAW